MQTWMAHEGQWMARATLPNDTTVKRNWHGPAYLKVRCGFWVISSHVDVLGNSRACTLGVLARDRSLCDEVLRLAGS